MEIKSPQRPKPNKQLALLVEEGRTNLLTHGGFDFGTTWTFSSDEKEEADEN